MAITWDRPPLGSADDRMAAHRSTILHVSVCKRAPTVNHQQSGSHAQAACVDSSRSQPQSPGSLRACAPCVGPYMQSIQTVKADSARMSAVAQQPGHACSRWVRHVCRGVATIKSCAHTAAWLRRGHAHPKESPQKKRTRPAGPPRHSQPCGPPTRPLCMLQHPRERPELQHGHPHRRMCNAMVFC